MHSSLLSENFWSAFYERVGREGAGLEGGMLLHHLHVVHNHPTRSMCLNLLIFIIHQHPAKYKNMEWPKLYFSSTTKMLLAVFFVCIICVCFLWLQN